VIVTEWPAFLQKRFHPEIGLALIDPDPRPIDPDRPLSAP
jgi:hypothetical protein